MESFYSSGGDKVFDASLHTEFAPYLKTAGTVLIGWMVVTWIWHIICLLFAPAVVSAIAIFLVSPQTLMWFLTHFKPAVESMIIALVQRCGVNLTDLQYD